MTLKRWAGRMAHFEQMIMRKGGLIFAVYSLYWRFKTAWYKAGTKFQDRYGLFDYTSWIRDNEVPPHPSVRNESETAVWSLDTVHISLVIQYRLEILEQRWGMSEANALFWQTIRSLEAQTSSAWEICLLGDLPEGFSQLVADWPQDDKDHQGQYRWFRDVGAGEGALSKALMLARGEWVMILNPGDTVSPDLCTELSQLAQQPEPPEIVYFDQDHLSDEYFIREKPVFWPDWSPDLLLSANYLENACIQNDLLRACAAQSQSNGEALLRCVEQARRIVHIARILYHRASAVPADGILSLRFSASEAADHLQRLGVADAQIAEDALKRARFSWSVSGRLVSIIIPSRDRREYLERCLTSIHQSTHYRNYEIVIVDNNSQEADTLAYYAQLQQAPNTVVLKNQTAFNYSAYNNLGARHAHGDLLLFLNNDVEVIDPCWLDELVQWAERREIGAVGAKLLYPDGTIQHAGIVVGMEGHGSHVFMGQREGYTGLFGSVDWYRDVSAITGACLMMRREVFEKIGAFDEDYLLVFNDIEICVRVLAHGYRVVYNPFARLIHYEGKSRGRYIPPDDIRLGYEHLKDIVAQGDSYYNPNLSYAVRVPTLRRTWEEDRLQRLETIARLAI